MPTSRPRLSHEDYLARIETLAHAVVAEAVTEGCLQFDPAEDEEQTPLQRAINELGRALRFVHNEGDGCHHD